MIDLKSIPDALKEGESWDLLDIDPDWLWIARNSEGQPVGILLAANCHGLIFIMRIKMLPSASQWSLGCLLRRFIRDMRRRRGVMGYFTVLDATRPEEMAIMRIIFRAGGQIGPANTVVFGSVNAKHVPEAA